MKIADALHSFIDLVFRTKESAEKTPFADLSGRTTQTVRDRSPAPNPKAIDSLSGAIAAYRKAGNSILEQQLFERIKELAHDFDDWSEVVEGMPASSAARQQALSTLAAAASGLEEKITVYDLAEEESLKESIFRELTSQTRSYDEWRDIFQKADPGTPLERFAAERAIEMVPEKVDAVASIASFDEIEGDPELKAASLKKLAAVEGSFEEWRQVSRDYGGAIEDIAIEKMIAKVEDLEQLSEAVDVVEDDDESEMKLVARFKSLAFSKEDLEKILRDYNSDSHFFIAAFEKLLEAADTTLQCLKLFLDWELENDESEKVLGKLFSLATPSECAIIALVAEEGSDLREEAEKRVDQT